MAPRPIRTLPNREYVLSWSNVETRWNVIELVDAKLLRELICARESEASAHKVIEYSAPKKMQISSRPRAFFLFLHELTMNALLARLGKLDCHASVRNFNYFARAKSLVPHNVADLKHLSSKVGEDVRRLRGCWLRYRF